jgi:LysR family transcriptional regulator, cyn operon transcriptional activator
MLIRQAHYILAVADHGNFTRAASALHISQPALSQRIIDLEGQLGVRLFDRSGRTVKPTDEGRTYIEHVRRALRELNAGERAMQDVAKAFGGTLRVAFLPTFTTHLVGPLIQEFYMRHPGVSVTIDILAQAALEAALVEDRIDIGLAFSDVDSDEIEVERIQEDELCLVVGKRHPMYRKDKVRVSELKRSDLALLTHAFITRAPIDRYFRSHNVRPRIAIEANSADSIIAIVRGAPIATVMPSATARQLPGLKAVPILPSAGTWTLSVLQRKDAYRSAASKALVTILKQRKAMPGFR